MIDYNTLTFRGVNIGINTTTPTSKLHITHSSTSLQTDVGTGAGLYVNNPTNSAGQNNIICNRISGSSYI